MSDENIYSFMIQNINISTEMTRDQIFELGRKPPYFNINYPINITEEIKLEDNMELGQSQNKKHNRLAGTMCYLIGAIDLCPESGISWRREMTSWLKPRGVIAIDPTNKPMLGDSDSVVSAKINLEKSRNDYTSIREKYSYIRVIDLRCVDKSDFLICRIDPKIPTTGTIEELTTANRQKKPVLVYCDEGKQYISNWIHLMLPHQLIFDSKQEMLPYLNHIDQDNQIDTLNRWVFFDWSKLENE